MSLYFLGLLPLVEDVVGDDRTTEGPKVHISLVQQIFDEMFSKIEGQEEFNPNMINELKQLAAIGDLKKSQKIAKVIKSALTDCYETA